MLRRLVFLLLLSARASLSAAETRVELTGDVFDSRLSIDGNLVYRGHAAVRSENFLLTADEIRFEQKSETFFATGHVVFTREGARLLADRLEYHRRNGHFSAQDIRLGIPPYFATGASAEGSRSEITIRQARVSYGEPGPWQPTMVADAITIAPGQTIRTEKASAGIGQTQPFSIPRFEHEVTRPFPLAIDLKGGFRRSLGAHADATALVPVAPGLLLGGSLGVYTRRGVMAGPAARYEAAGNPNRPRGFLRSGYIHDGGDRQTDILSRPIGADRAFVEWEHQQSLGDRLTLNARLNWWKDSDVLRDFRPEAYFPVQEPDTFVEAVYTGANYFVSTFARFQPNRYQAVQERLPEVRFDLLPLALGNGFYHRFNASLAVLRERAPTRSYSETYTVAFGGEPTSFVSNHTLGGTTVRTTRLDAYYAIERPFAPVEWLALTPIAGARFTHYSRTPRVVTLTTASVPPHYSQAVVDRGSYTRPLGELGFDAVLRTSGTFNTQNPRWKIDGLRHLFTPRLSYRYIPKGDLGRGQLPLIDRETFATYLPPLGLGDTRHIDDLHATNTLRLGFDNTLQTRDPVLGSRDLLTVNVANDFRFRRRPGERQVSEIHAEIAALPARWLQFDLYQSFAPQTFALRELNSGVTLRDGTAWTLRFGNNFLRRELQDYTIDARRRLNERFEAIARLRYDARRHRFNEQTYGVAHNLANTWVVSYSVSVYSGRKRESNFGFDLRIDALNF